MVCKSRDAFLPHFPVENDPGQISWVQGIAWDLDEYQKCVLGKECLLEASNRLPMDN